MRNNYLLFGLLALAACTQDNMPAPEEEIKPEVKPEIGSEEKFLAVAPEFKVHSAGKMVNPNSRVDVGISGGKISYYWENTDVIGIFPKADDKNEPFNGDQVYFKLNPLDNTDAKQASFDGGGWSVKKGFTYKAYTPFNKADGFGQDMTKMPVKFTEQKATATGNYLKDRIYMISDGTATADGSLQFSFYTITSLGVCNVNLPEAGTITSLKFDFTEAEIKPFCTEGHFNLEMTGKANADNAITNTTPSATFTIAANVAYEKGTPSQIKFVQAPLKGITGKTAKVTVAYTAGGTSKTSVIQYTFGKEWIAGDAYIFEFNFPAIDTSTHTVTVEKEGTLTKAAAYQAMNGQSKLIVKGKINGDDVTVLRQLAGGEPTANAASRGGNVLLQLTNLVLTDAEVVAGGQQNTTVANTFTANIFKGCSSLQKLTLPKALVKIEGNAFDGTSIEALDLPGSITEILKDAFANMPKLTSIKVNSAPANINITAGFLGTTGTEGNTVPANVTIELTDSKWNYSDYAEKLEGINSSGAKEVTVPANDVNPDPEINPWNPGNGGELVGE